MEKSRDVFQHFPRKCLLDKVRPWYTFVCSNLLPTTHLSDVSRERAILLDAIVIGASIDVGRVIFYNYIQSIRSTSGGIAYPYLITGLSSLHGVT